MHQPQNGDVRGVLVTDRCIVLSPAFLKELFCLRFGQVPTQNKFTHGEVAAPIRINELEPQTANPAGDVSAHMAGKNLNHHRTTRKKNVTVQSKPGISMCFKIIYIYVCVHNQSINIYLPT